MHSDITPFAKPVAGKSKEKSHFDLSMENHINKYLDSLNLEVEYRQNPIISPAMKRAQLREELQSSLLMPELEKFLTDAFKALLSSNHHYLSSQVCRQMEQEFNGIEKELDKINFNEPSQESYQKLLKISDPIMDAILTIAAEKYKEEEYTTSLAIYTLLATLNAGNFNYWYRLGISAQKCENYPLALKAYEMALEISPKLLGAYLFSSECHLRLEQKEAAKECFVKAKEIANDEAPEEMWVTLMSKIEKALQ